MAIMDGQSHPSDQEIPNREIPDQEFSSNKNENNNENKDENKNKDEKNAKDNHFLVGSGLIETVEALWNNLQGLLRDQLQLALLETLNAGKNLLAIALYTLVVALLVVSAWLCAVGAGVMWCIHSGMNTSVALLLAMVINLLGVLGFFYAIVHHSYSLRFPATMNTLSTPFRGSAAAKNDTSMR